MLEVLQGRCPYRLDGTRLALGTGAELCYGAAAH